MEKLIFILELSDSALEYRFTSQSFWLPYFSNKNFLQIAICNCFYKILGINFLPSNRPYNIVDAVEQANFQYLFVAKSVTTLTNTVNIIKKLSFVFHLLREEEGKEFISLDWC